MPIPNLLVDHGDHVTLNGQRGVVRDAADFKVILKTLKTTLGLGASQSSLDRSLMFKHVSDGGTTEGSFRPDRLAGLQGNGRLYYFLNPVVSGDDKGTKDYLDRETGVTNDRFRKAEDHYGVRQIVLDCDYPAGTSLEAFAAALKSSPIAAYVSYIAETPTDGHFQYAVKVPFFLFPWALGRTANWVIQGKPKDHEDPNSRRLHYPGGLSGKAYYSFAREADGSNSLHVSEALRFQWHETRLGEEPTKRTSLDISADDVARAESMLSGKEVCVPGGCRDFVSKKVTLPMASQRLADYKGVEAVLAFASQADPAAVGLTRVGRVPGFDGKAVIYKDSKLLTPAAWDDLKEKLLVDGVLTPFARPHGHIIPLSAYRKESPIAVDYLATPGYESYDGSALTVAFRSRLRAATNLPAAIIGSKFGASTLPACMSNGFPASPEEFVRAACAAAKGLGPSIDPSPLDITGSRNRILLTCNQFFHRVLRRVPSQEDIEWFAKYLWIYFEPRTYRVRGRGINGIRSTLQCLAKVTKKWLKVNNSPYSEDTPLLPASGPKLKRIGETPNPRCIADTPEARYRARAVYDHLMEWSEQDSFSTYMSQDQLSEVMGFVASAAGRHQTKTDVMKEGTAGVLSISLIIHSLAWKKQFGDGYVSAAIQPLLDSTWNGQPIMYRAKHYAKPFRNGSMQVLQMGKMKDAHFEIPRVVNGKTIEDRIEEWQTYRAPIYEFATDYEDRFDRELATSTDRDFVAQAGQRACRELTNQLRQQSLLDWEDMTRLLPFDRVGVSDVLSDPLRKTADRYLQNLDINRLSQVKKDHERLATASSTRRLSNWEADRLKALASEKAILERFSGAVQAFAIEHESSGSFGASLEEFARYFLTSKSLVRDSNWKEWMRTQKLIPPLANVPVEMLRQVGVARPPPLIVA